MEGYEYGKMYDLEDRLWWYRGVRLYFREAIRRANLPSEATVLDAGCGTGANLVLLSQMFTRTIGCDLAETAVAFSTERGHKRVLVADVNHLPFKNGVFDCVLCGDVLECREVDERRAVAVAGVEIVGMRYLFGFFLLPIVTYRLLRRLLRRGKRASSPQSDLFLPPRFVNELLFGLARAEAALSRFGRLPFGTTLLVEMKRT